MIQVTLLPKDSGKDTTLTENWKKWKTFSEMSKKEVDGHEEQLTKFNGLFRNLKII